MKFKSLIAPILALGLLASCEEIFDNDMQPDGSRPSVTVHAPTANHSFTKANGVTLNLTVVDKDNVQDLNVQIKDLHGETVVYNHSQQPNKTAIVLDTVVAQNQIKPGTYRLIITAKDARANIEKQELTFKVTE